MINSMLMREIKCPFCGCLHIKPACINVLCSCGAKYYIHNGEFWERKPSGKIVKDAPFRIFDIEED